MKRYKFFINNMDAAALDRIGGSIARIDDLVWRIESEIFVETLHPGEFITAFYDDGFTEELRCAVL